MPITWAVVILVCAGVYGLWCPDQFSNGTGKPMGLLDSLYLSVVTFTTLGYGDWRPTDLWPARFVAMGEALLGASLMALFVVCLARRWGRG